MTLVTSLCVLCAYIGSERNKKPKEYKMKNFINQKLEEAGIRTDGIYQALPDLIEDAVETVNMFGFEVWVNNSTLGNKAENIVRELSNEKAH